MWRTIAVARRERVFHFVDGQLKAVLPPGRHWLWTWSGQHQFERVTLEPKAALAPLPAGDTVPAGVGATEFSLGPLERALVLLDGALVGAVGPGRYRWWDELGAPTLLRFPLDVAPEPLAHDDPVPTDVPGWCVVASFTGPAVWTRGGRALGVRPPGRYRLWAAAPWTLEPAPRDLVPLGAQLLDPVPPGARIIEVAHDQRVALYLDGAFLRTLTPGRYLGWDAVGRFELTTFSTSAKPAPVADVDTIPGAVEQASNALQALVVLRSGLPVEVAPVGRYRTWPGSVWSLKPVPLSLQTLDVAPQDLLTEDQVPVRLKAAVSVRVVDPVKVLSQPDWPNQVYAAVQLAMREVVTARTLEALLADRGPAAAALAERARALLPDVGIALETASVKDVILPGEVKDLLNRVTLARKEAEALGIRRREEVAATRQLANTARLLENNPVLMRLKELESLGELAARIERITLVGSGDLVQQVLLSNLPSVRGPTSDGPADR